MANEEKPIETLISDEKRNKIIFWIVIVLIAILGIPLIFGWASSKISGSSSGEDDGGSGTTSSAAAFPTCFGGRFEVAPGDTVRTVPTVDENTGRGCRYAINSHSQSLFMVIAGQDGVLFIRSITEGNSIWRGEDSRERGLFWVTNRGRSVSVIEFRFLGVVPR